VVRPDLILPRPCDTGTKALSFGLIGVLNTVVDATAFALLLWLGLPVLAANFLAWMCGVTLSYNLNSRFTFQDRRNRGRAPAWLRFAATGGAVNLLCSTLLLSGLSDVIGIWPAKALAVAIGAVLGFRAARWSIEGKA
jgi:putative flippase GtrA